MVMPASPGAGLVLVQPHVAFLRLELRFYSPHNGILPRRLRVWKPGNLWGVGTDAVYSVNAAVLIPAVNGPVDFAGLTPAGWTHPLGTEQVAACSPWLPSATVISRHASSVMAVGFVRPPPVVRRSPLRSLGLRGRPLIPDTPHWWRQTPAGQHRKAGTERPARTTPQGRHGRRGMTATSRRHRPQRTHPAFRWQPLL